MNKNTRHEDALYEQALQAGRMITNRPLVSFCVKFYNQDRFVERALEGAFSQTYEPMEIVIVDDASTDGTWQKIIEVVDKYKREGGKKTVRHYRNEQNLGNAGNWQKLCSLAKGELLVKADGDDVSLSERTERIVDFWQGGGKQYSLIVHNAIKINAKGERCGVMHKDDGIFGAATAYSRKCFDLFGDIKVEGAAADDEIYYGRAELLGGIAQMEDQLVLYSLGTGVSNSRKNFRKMMVKNMRIGENSIRQCVIDLEYYKPKMLQVDYEKFRSSLEWKLEHLRKILLLWDGANIFIRLCGFCEALRGGLFNKGGMISCILLFPKSISEWALDALRH